MKLTRWIALMLAAVMIGCCLCACGGSDAGSDSASKTADNQTGADAEEPTEEPAPADTHEGMVQFNLIKTITTNGDKVCTITRDELGNTIHFEEPNGYKETFDVKVKDERDTANKYTAPLNEDGDQYVEYTFGDDGKLTQIMYISSSTTLTLTKAPADAPVEGAVFYVEDIYNSSSGSRVKKDYYNEKYQRLYNETYYKDSGLTTWRKYYYGDDGKIVKEDDFGSRGLETNAYCEGGRRIGRNSKGEIVTECTIEKDASGRVIKDNHSGKIYTYAYNADGSVSSMEFYTEDNNGGEVGSTTTYRADGSVETDYYYQINRFGTKAEQTVAYEPFYILDDELLFAFLTVIGEYWSPSGLKVCFGDYCSLETLSYR